MKEQQAEQAVWVAQVRSWEGQAGLAWLLCACQHVWGLHSNSLACLPLRSSPALIYLSVCSRMSARQVRARQQEQLEHEEGYLQMGDATLKLMKE